MAAAGFKFVPANTPARQASFKYLPPHKFSREIKNGQVFYVYPDPTVCVCLYVGSQPAYAKYQGNVFQKNLADEQQMTANINSMNDWDWGPWGGTVSRLVLLALAPARTTSRPPRAAARGGSSRSVRTRLPPRRARRTHLGAAARREVAQAGPRPVVIACPFRMPPRWRTA